MRRHELPGKTKGAGTQCPVFLLFVPKVSVAVSADVEGGKTAVPLGLKENPR